MLNKLDSKMMFLNFKLRNNQVAIVVMSLLQFVHVKATPAQQNARPMTSSQEYGRNLKLQFLLNRPSDINKDAITGYLKTKPTLFTNQLSDFLQQLHPEDPVSGTLDLASPASAKRSGVLTDGEAAVSGPVCERICRWCEWSEMLARRWTSICYFECREEGENSRVLTACFTLWAITAARNEAT